MQPPATQLLLEIVPFGGLVLLLRIPPLSLRSLLLCNQKTIINIHPKLVIYGFPYYLLARFLEQPGIVLNLWPSQFYFFLLIKLCISAIDMAKKVLLSNIINIYQHTVNFVDVN